VGIELCGEIKAGLAGQARDLPETLPGAFG